MKIKELFKEYWMVLFLLTKTVCIHAQNDSLRIPQNHLDSLNILVLSEKIGETIDSLEKKEYHLFPYYSSAQFQSARFFEKEDGSIILQTQFKNGDIKIMPFSKTAFYETQKLVGAALINSSTTKSKKISKHIFYLEVLGSMNPLSLNYERILKNRMFSIRVGISKRTITEYPGISFWGPSSPIGGFKIIPVLTGINICTGKKKHHFEFGVGIIYNHIYDSWIDPSSAKNGENIQYRSYLSAAVNAGYRFEPIFQSFFLKSGIASYIDKYAEQGLFFGPVSPMPYLAIGFSI